MKGRSVKVSFKIVDGKIHVRNLQVTPDEYRKVAETIKSLIDHNMLQNKDFSASINIPL